MNSLIYAILFSFFQATVFGVDCNPEISSFYDCAFSSLQQTPEEDAMIDRAMSCFKDNGCRNPDDIRTCMMNTMSNKIVPDMQVCLKNGTNVPAPDFDRLKQIRVPFVGLKLMREGKQDVLLKLMGDLCNGNAQNTQKAQQCLVAMANATGGVSAATNASIGGLLGKFGKIKNCWTKLDPDCKQELIKAKNVLCCCANTINLKSRMEDAAGGCGVSKDDFETVAGEMGGLIKKFCSHANCGSR